MMASFTPKWYFYHHLPNSLRRSAVESLVLVNAILWAHFGLNLLFFLIIYFLLLGLSFILSFALFRLLLW